MFTLLLIDIIDHLTEHKKEMCNILCLTWQLRWLREETFTNVRGFRFNVNVCLEICLIFCYLLVNDLQYLISDAVSCSGLVFRQLLLLVSCFCCSISVVLPWPFIYSFISFNGIYNRGLHWDWDLVMFSNIFCLVPAWTKQKSHRDGWFSLFWVRLDHSTVCFNRFFCCAVLSKCAHTFTYASTLPSKSRRSPKKSTLSHLYPQSHPFDQHSEHVTIV